MKRFLILALAILLILASMCPIGVALAEDDVQYYDPETNEILSRDGVTVHNGAMPIPLETGWHLFTGTFNTSSQIVINGDVNLILGNGCNLVADKGIQVLDGNLLTIWAQTGVLNDQGSLTATGGANTSGIGGGDSATIGTITINGGHVTATGGYGGAGIGSGNEASSGTITINHGTVIATGSGGGAGIGGGPAVTGGTITINNGLVTATGSEGGAGIGGGIRGTGGTITINGGEVNATGDGGGAGIGGGDSRAGGTIEITGGYVDATGGRGGAGIGGGSSAAGGTISINGCVLFAIGDGGGAGIGGGYKGAMGTIGIGSSAQVKSMRSQSSRDKYSAYIGTGAGEVAHGIEALGLSFSNSSVAAGASVSATLSKVDGFTLGESDNYTWQYWGSDYSWTTIGAANSGDPTGFTASMGQGTHNIRCVVNLNGQFGVASTEQWLTVTKPTGAAVSGAPTQASVTASSITVNAVTNDSGNGQTVEYGISTSAGAEPTTWQSGLTFSNLSPNTAYYVFARTASNDDFDEGAQQVSAAITTQSNPSPAPDPGPTPAPQPTPDPGKAQPVPVVDPDEVEKEEPVESDRGMDKDIPVTGMAAGSTIYVNFNVKDSADNVVLHLENVPVVLQEIRGLAHVELTPGLLGTLPVGKYSLWIESAGDALNNPIRETLVGRFAIVRRTPQVAGNKAPRVLPGTRFDAAFAVDVSGLGTVTPVEMKLTCAGQQVTASRVGDGELCFTLPLQLSAAGDYPVTVSAGESLQTLAMAETTVGMVTVVDVAQYLTGELKPVLGADYLYGKATEQVPVAFQAKRAVLDADTNILTAVAGEALKVGIKYAPSCAVTGYLTRVRNDPFSTKDAQQTPSKVALKAAKTLQSKVKKAAVFSFNAQDMGRLKPGYYQFVAVSKQIGELTMATIRVVDGDAQPADWTMPRALKLSVGQVYQLVRGVPAENTLPNLVVKSSNKKAAAISADGVLTTKKAGAATITVTGPNGERMKCKLTVVSNSWSRKKPLYVKNRPGLYTSTNRLYYKGSELKAQVFVYNRTGKKLSAATGWTFELYNGETLIYQRPIDPATYKKPLKHKQYKAFGFSITDAQLPGIAAKSFDLATGQIQAVIRGADITPLVGGHIGVAQAKSIEAQDAGDIAPVVPAA